MIRVLFHYPGLFDRKVVNRYPNAVLRRDGRVVEGAPLLREYRLKKLIEGSNPSLSAIIAMRSFSRFARDSPVADTGRRGRQTERSHPYR